MANIFDRANDLKNEAKEIEKTLTELKLTSERLEEVQKAISEIENLDPTLITISNEIKKIKEEYETIDGKAISNAINDLMTKIFNSWKLWLLYIPLGSFLIALSIITYMYISFGKKFQQQNEFLNDRIDLIYRMELLDDKNWYNKESKTKYLGDNKWIKEKIEEAKKNNKK